MSMVYSEIQNEYIDTDTTGIITLSNDDVVAEDDDEGLIQAYIRDLISRADMRILGFTNDELIEVIKGE